jgi:hypothetical protein
MPSNSKSGENSRENDTKTTESGKKQNTSNRGFASMDEAKQREIASKGGKASHGGGRTPGSGKGGNKSK